MSSLQKAVRGGSRSHWVSHKRTPVKYDDRYDRIWYEQRHDCKPVITIEEIYDYLKSGTIKPVLIKFMETLKIKSQKIMHLIEQYMETKYYEFDVRKQIQSQFHIEFQKFITTEYYTKDPYDIFIDYIRELDKFCAQGSTSQCGIGHRVVYKSVPSHWVLRVEHYEKMGQIPEYIEEIKELYCGLVELSISPIAKHEVWGN